MQTIDQFRNIKVLKAKLDNLKKLESHLTTSIEILKPYSLDYNPISECISVLHNSRTLIEININKCNRELNEKTN